MRASALCLGLGLCLLAGEASAASVGISKLETKDLQLLYFDPIQTYLTPYVARAYENSFAFQERTFGWTPWDRPTIFLTDLTDNGGAAVRSTPNNGLFVNIAPISQIFETFSGGERFFILMNHEMVHVATMDAWNDEDAFWRHAFHGKPLPISDHPESILYNYLTVPRVNVPRWYLEGSAVFMETWMGGGIGRAQGGYDEMVFRAMVRDDARFFDPLGLESEGNAVDFQIGANDYLYGTRFDTYLALTYGPEKVIEWLKRGKDSDRFYSNQFERVFGKPLDDAWQDWIKFEHEYQKQNLAALEKYPVTKGQRLTPTALGSVSRMYYDPKTDSLVGGFRAPGVIAHMGVISLKDGSERKLANIKGPALYRVTSIAFDPSTGTVWYTEDNNAFRDLMQIDEATGEAKMLIRDARIGDLVFDKADRSIWGLRHVNGLVSLVRLDPPYTSWHLVHVWPYGEIPYDLDISSDGTAMSASIGEVDGHQQVNIYRIDDLLADKAQPIASFSFGLSVPEGFVFSPDQRYLYGSAYYTGVSNIYRYELRTGKIEAVSNTTTGFFRPIPLADGSLIAFEYTGQGFMPERFEPKPTDDLGTIKFLGTVLADTHPVVKSWAVGSPARVPLDSMITDKGEYIPQQELRFDSTYPFVEGYKAHAAIGWYVHFADPLQFNQLSATIAYSPADNIRPGEQYHADLSYKTLYWRVEYWHNKADFYDLFGPTDHSRKGDALLGGYHETLVFDPPRQLDFDADVELYSGLDTLPQAQNVPTSDKMIATVKAGLVYTNTDKSIGAADYEAGYRWNLNFQNDYANNADFPKLRGGFDFGFALPWEHSSLWLYSSAGVAGGTNTNPLNDYYFGAFGNNYVDDGTVRRYREYDSFPGFDIDAIGPRNFLKSTVEWNMPPVRFADVGVPSFYLGTLTSALFGGLLAGDPGAHAASTSEDLGFQVDLNFTVALRLPMTFSVGYAHGFSDTIKSRDEIMASLKIL
jgi:hypothetical protein